MAAHQGVPGEYREFVESATKDPPHTHYTYAEVASAFKVSIQTVESWVKRGRVPSPIYIGTTARFDMSALLAMLRGVGQDHSHPITDSPRAAQVRGAIHQARKRANRIAREISKKKTVHHKTPAKNPRGKRKESAT